MVAGLSCVNALAAQQQLLPFSGDVYNPTAVVQGSDGYLYVVDQGSNRILRIDEDMRAEVVAGYTLPNTIYGTPAGGYRDGAAAQALFDAPFALVEWKDSLIVSDTQNHMLRRIRNGQVETLAGTGTEGYRDGQTGTAMFSLPMGLAVDDQDNIYVADCGNGIIRKISSQGTVSTYLKGLEAPTGLYWYEDALYIADAGLNQILCASDGSYEVLAGAHEKLDEIWVGGFADGPALEARFSSPMGIFVNEDGVYIADSGNGAVRLLSEGRVNTLVFHDRDMAQPWPATPTGIMATDSSVYVADSFAGIVFSVQTAGGFRDVGADDWFAPSVETISRAGLMVGTTADTFSPYRTLTRAMTAVILHNYQQSLDYNAVFLGTAAFPDVVDGSWCAEAISWLADSGVITGYADGTFGVNGNISRQSFVTMLYRYAQYLGADTSARGDCSGFVDVDSVGQHARDAMAWAVGTGILSGTQSGELMPLRSITRAEACVILDRWMGVVEQA